MPETEIPTDLLTPLGAYLALREAEGSFLLESVERGSDTSKSRLDGRAAPAYAAAVTSVRTRWAWRIERGGSLRAR